MNSHMLKLALGALAVAALGFAVYKFMQKEKQEVVVQSQKVEQTEPFYNCLECM